MVKLGSPYLTCLKFYSFVDIMSYDFGAIALVLCCIRYSLEDQIFTCITCTKVYVKLLLDDQ